MTNCAYYDLKGSKSYLNYNIHDIIRIRSNMPVAPPCFIQEPSEYVDVEMYRDGKLESPLSRLTPLGLRLFYDEDTLIHKCRFFLDAHLQIQDPQNKFILNFNRMYELVRNPKAYFLAFLQMKLLDKGFTFIHAAGVINNGESLLFPAFSDTGKTTTTLSFIKDGYNVLGDDKIITNGQNIFPYPQPIRKKIFRPFDKIPFLRKIKFRKLFYPPIVPKAYPNKLFFLTIGNKNEVKEVYKKDITEKINTMTEATCPLFPYPMGVMLGYYFIRDIPLNTYVEKRKRIMLQLINKCETFMVTAKRSPEFYSLIKKKIENE